MKWRVTAEVTISVTTLVEAATEEEAKLKAMEHGMSHSFRDDGNQNEEWVHDELDGEPRIVEVYEDE